MPKKPRILKIPLYDILDLVVCAEDYGFTELLPDFWQLIDCRLSDSEIKAYAKYMLQHNDEYTTEDYDHFIDYLTEYRDNYKER